MHSSSDDWYWRDEAEGLRKVMEQVEKNRARLRDFLDELINKFLRRLQIMRTSWRITTLRGVRVRLGKGITGRPNRLLWDGKKPVIMVNVDIPSTPEQEAEMQRDCQEWINDYI